MFESKCVGGLIKNGGRGMLARERLDDPPPEPAPQTAELEVRYLTALMRIDAKVWGQWMRETCERMNLNHQKESEAG